MVTTHLGDLKTYAFHNERAENGAVEFDVETLRPTYRLHIGQFGMSNALQIARRLKLPRDLLKRATRYLRRRQKRAPEMAQLQQLREEAEKAREEALAAQHEAEQQREELRHKTETLEREAEEAAALREARLRLQPGDPVQRAALRQAGPDRARRPQAQRGRGQRRHRSVGGAAGGRFPGGEMSVVGRGGGPVHPFLRPFQLL